MSLALKTNQWCNYLPSRRFGKYSFLDSYDVRSRLRTKNKDSNSKLAIQDENGNWVVPFVIEPSAGVERGFLAILNEAFSVEKIADGKERTVLKLKPHLHLINMEIFQLII